MPTRVLLDVDTGTDDALALLYAVAHPDLELIGVSCVAGNSGLEQVLVNTAKVLDAAQAPDIPIAGGAARPLLERRRPEGHFHGVDGLGGIALPDPQRPVAPHGARGDAARCDPVQPGAGHAGGAGPADQHRVAAQPLSRGGRAARADRLHGWLGQRRERDRSGGVQCLAGPGGGGLRRRLRHPDHDVRARRLHPAHRRPRRTPTRSAAPRPSRPAAGRGAARSAAARDRTDRVRTIWG